MVIFGPRGSRLRRGSGGGGDWETPSTPSLPPAARYEGRETETPGGARKGGCADGEGEGPGEGEGEGGEKARGRIEIRIGPRKSSGTRPTFGCSCDRSSLSLSFAPALLSFSLPLALSPRSPSPLEPFRAIPDSRLSCYVRREARGTLGPSPVT
jgi:hypothetical protein